MFKQPSLYNIDHIAEALMFKQPSLYNIDHITEALMFKQPSLYNIDHIAEAMFKQPSLYNIAEALCSSNHLCIILTILQKPYVQATISV